MTDTTGTPEAEALAVTPDHRAHLAFDRWADRHPDAPAYWFRLPSWVQDYATECVRATEARLTHPQSSDVEAMREACAQWHDRMAQTYAYDVAYFRSNEADEARIDKYEALRQEHAASAAAMRAMELHS